MALARAGSPRARAGSSRAGLGCLPGLWRRPRGFHEQTSWVRPRPARAAAQGRCSAPACGGGGRSTQLGRRLDNRGRGRAASLSHPLPRLGLCARSRKPLRPPPLAWPRQQSSGQRPDAAYALRIRRLPQSLGLTVVVTAPPPRRPCLAAHPSHRPPTPPPPLPRWPAWPVWRAWPAWRAWTCLA